MTAVSFLLGVLLAAPPNYVTEIATSAVFEDVSRETRARPDIRRSTKFLVPAAADVGLLPPVYQNVNVYDFHLDFMAAEFPERFPGLAVDEYRRITEQRASRLYFAGTLSLIRTDDGDEVYGFDFYTDPGVPDELPRVDEVAWVHARLGATFALRPLVYAPLRTDVIEVAREWTGTPFAVYLPGGDVAGNFAAYTSGTAYGRVRFFSLAELIAAGEAGTLTAQEIIVVDEAPSDITAPVSAVITGGPQTELSHLSLRLAQRGTPNAFIGDYAARLGEFRDELVRIDLDDRSLAVRVVDDPAEAEEWWAENRPRLGSLPPFDLSEEDVVALDELIDDADATARYGAKAKNLALLRSVLPPGRVVDGFAVPFAWYQRFLEDGRIINDDRELVSYDVYLAELEADERFRTDSVYRTLKLDELVAHAEFFGIVAEEVVAAMAQKVAEVYGDTERMIRCRSSANLEDIVPFNGAGLYESTSACAADSLDADNRGPSRCDEDRDDERTIEDALRRVWASTWLPRAYNERDFWQVPHERAKMGVLVTPTFADELANGVVLTGNPALPGDDRLLINVQIGETSIVSPEPGVLPEKIVVAVDGGVATSVDRVRASTIVPEGEWILSIDEAREVAELASRAAQELAPLFETTLGEIIFDLEFKVSEVDGERTVIFKQLRPFLRAEAEEGPELAIVVPEGTATCGVFQENRALREEYELLSTIDWIGGRLTLPGRAGSVTGDLFERIVVGPEKVVAEPVTAGRFTCSVERDGTRTFYDYSFSQEYLVGGEPLLIEVAFPEFWARESGDGRTELVIDDAVLSFEAELAINGALGDGVDTSFLSWRSCGYESLSSFRSRFVATTGETAVVELRHHPVLQLTGPESVTAASIDIDGASRRQEDYWRLVYAADHHNWNREFWVFLDPPVGEAHVAELHEPTRLPQLPAVFRLLDEQFEVVRELEVAEWSRARVAEPRRPDFVRGDVDGDGVVAVPDLVALLEAVFRGGGPIACPDAADTDDDGRVAVTDAVRLVIHQFRRDDVEFFEIPFPGTLRCGQDLTEDSLEGCGYDVGSCPD